jgi:pimeloyl-ACP methyl ester carboxylesterase
MLLIRNLFLGSLGVGIIAYLGICVSLSLWQNRLIFKPSSTIEITPEELNLPHEEIWLPVPNKGKGENSPKMHGFWFPSTSPNSPVILYLHGNGGNVTSNLNHAKRFHSLGFAVLVMDYRGYGKSGGDFPTEQQVYQDTQIMWDYLVQGRGINPKDIIIYGHSLGGAIAIDLASKNPHMAGLIIQGSFTSMVDMVDFLGIYDLFPNDLILNQKFDSLSKLKSLQVPLLFIHGEEDDIVPASMSNTLFDVAIAPKSLWLVEGANHNDVAKVSGDKYLQKILEFRDLVMGKSSQDRTLSISN